MSNQKTIEAIKSKSKITKATVKSFIKKNFDQLFIENKRTFDGSIDGERECEKGFKKAVASEKHNDYTLGIEGAWFVGDSRDYFKVIENDKFFGFNVYNACGSFNIAIAK